MESVKQRSEAFRSDKTSFCDKIPAEANKSSNIIMKQPSSNSNTENKEPDDHFLPERDGKADGMSSDESFSYDVTETVKSEESDWDTYVTGVENNNLTHVIGGNS